MPWFFFMEPKENHLGFWFDSKTNNWQRPWIFDTQFSTFRNLNEPVPDFHLSYNIVHIVLSLVCHVVHHRRKPKYRGINKKSNSQYFVCQVELENITLLKQETDRWLAYKVMTGVTIIAQIYLKLVWSFMPIISQVFLIWRYKFQENLCQFLIHSFNYL